MSWGKEAEELIEKTKKAMEGEDAKSINEAKDKLLEKANALATKVYENVQKERSNDDNNSDSSSDNDGKEHVTDAEFEEKIKQYKYCSPFTKESLLYREIFESYYPEQAGMIKDFWMPNKNWQGCNVNDPSARYLSNYGDSGK